jgi:hypothetical protein
MFNTAYANITDKIGDFNPQLLREIKGRLRPKNVIIVSIVSLIGQLLIYLLSREGIVAENEICYSYTRYCSSDLRIFWLDIFITMSIMGIFLLLVAGTYLLSNDLSKELKRGTLNFIRLSPQSATNIFIGKILGVPILLYLLGLTAFPLHFFAGLGAKIPLLLILSFYLVLALSCLFFFSLAIFFSLVNHQSFTNSNLSGSEGWIISLCTFFFLLIITSWTFSEHNYIANNSFDWLIFFSPATVLFYLIESTQLSADYFPFDFMSNLSWYGLNIFANYLSGIGFILANFALWSYFIWQGLTRVFYNPNATIISKLQSYKIATAFIIISVGFALESSSNFVLVQFFSFILFLTLIMTLTPQRQTVLEWARYRHNTSKENRNLLKDLLLGEKSPSTLAISLSILFVTTYTVLVMFLYPQDPSTVFQLALGFISGAMFAMIYALVTQLISTIKTKKGGNLPVLAIIGLTIFPPICAFVGYTIFGGNWSLLALIALPNIALTTNFSLPSIFFAILSQTLIISGLTFQMTRRFKQLGISETKALLSQGN